MISNLMTIVTEEQLKTFIEKYLSKFGEFSIGFSENNKGVFPKFLRFPYKIVGTISTLQGVSIEFIEQTSETTIEIKITSKRIETNVIPQPFGASVFFQIDGSNGIISNMSLFTQHFYERYKSQIAPGGTVVIGKGMNGLCSVSETGDVRFIDIQFGTILNNESILREIDCLWIFGDNSEQKFSLEEAERHAENDFNGFLQSFLISLQINTLDRITSNLEIILSNYEAIINKEDINEEELKKFIKDHPILLDPHAKRVLPEYPLGSEYRADFVVERSDENYIIVEIEKTTSKLFTQKGDQHSELTHAIGQVRDYQNWISENIAYVRGKLLNISEPHGLVIIGRKNSLNENNLRKLRYINQTSHNLKVFTFDDLLANGKQLLKNLRGL